MSRNTFEQREDDLPSGPSEQPNAEPEESPAPARPAWARALTGVMLALVILAAGVLGVRYWQYSTTHETTDDATLSANVIQIAPQALGVVKAVHVTDNQTVPAGQLLVELDDATYRAAVQQAEANLEAAIAQAEGAGISVSLVGDTGNAQIQQAQAGVAQIDGSIGSAQADVARTNALVQQATDNSQSVKANISTADAGVVAAQAQKKRAEAGVQSAAAQIDTAKANIKVAQAALESAQAIYGKAARDNERYQKLLEQGAIGAQMADQAAVAAQTAQAQVQTARQQVDANTAALAARQADYAAAIEQVAAAEAGIAQAKAQLAAAQQQYQSSLSGITQAQAQKRATENNVTQAQARRTQALGQLTQARTAPKQVGISQSGVKQAQARINQARAALETARVQLSYTRIFAPVAGCVSKKSVQEGVLVQPGTPLMALVPPPPANIWVVANYKETQLTRMQPGQRAVIKVDSFPGRPFTARVDSVASATGATFALLPPDNATGNFTKVVQRIPVKLVLDPDQSDLARLRAGMSVSVTIVTR
ncbi:MAG TPA: HlyD family secretion protein [Armatimonadota bacterium]|jgi:membrane fusion protein (multidrug efflux system)